MLPRRLAERYEVPPDDDPLWTLQEVCARIRRCERTVRRYIALGKFPPGLYLFGNCRPVWRKSAVERWLREQGEQ